MASPPSNGAEAQARFFAGGDADVYLEWRAAEVDRAVTGAWEEWVAPAAPAGLALLAVGGYGRRHLFPYSDVDLLLLFENDRAAQSSRSIVAPFLQQLWDSGLRVSQSVRTVPECTEFHDSNVELNISLLDARRLAGDLGLWEKLSARLPRFVSGQRQALVRALARLTRERHWKYGDTFYHLEPNIKETPGGLRDFQLRCWLGQLRAADGHRMPILAPPPELEPARRYFFALRCLLHFQAGRDTNLLNFESQEWVAGLAATGAPEGLRDPMAAAEAWMREYFRHARDIYREATRLLDELDSQAQSLFSQFRDWRSRLSNAEFSVIRERVYFKNPVLLDQSPELALRLFEFIGRHGIRPAPDTEQRLAARRPALAEYFRAASSLWQEFRDILSLPHAELALRVMHETGVLRLIFPEVEEIECLVIRDFYHRYTVDEHTLVTIQNLQDLRRLTDAPPAPDGAAEDIARAPYASLLGELEDPALLFFALLFHDIGKGAPDQGHVGASLRLAEGAMERIGMSEPERDMIRFLIGQHLALSEVLHSRDLDDDKTIRGVADLAGTVERLKALTLLTYGDISAVNPGAMTPWRAAQLFRLYRLTYNELTRELNSDRIAARPEDPPDKAAFLDGLPVRYIRTHSPYEVEQHFQLAAAAAARGVATLLDRGPAAWRLALVTGDRPNLFASIAGTLAAFGMNILKAEAFANRRGEVVDTFVFSDPTRTLELNQSERERLQVTLERVVLAKVDVRQLIRNRPAPSLPTRNARVAPTVSFDPDASETSTLIQIVAEDRPGLLYDLASAMSAAGCSIDIVLIDTEAHKAIDVFYVTGAEGKLKPETLEQLQADLVAACQR